MQIINKFIIELMGQAWIACLNYLKDMKIEMVLKGQVHTTTTIYGSKTTSTRQVKRLSRRYFFAFVKKN